MDAQVRLPGTRGIFCLGMLQILVWGGSFFLLAVMGEPIMRDTGWGSQWVYGALSLSLMISALLAPLSSRLVARFGGRAQLACSGLIVALGLLIVAACHTLPVFLLGWTVIGIGMAAGLYVALFSTLGALYAERAGRAITGITLISGFATTLTWPLVASAIEHVGWRATCVGYAVLLLLSSPLYLKVLPEGGRLRQARGTSEQSNPPVDRRVYLLLIWIFALGAIIMTAISVQLVAVLQGLGNSLAAAIALSSLLGPSQVASRVLQMIAGKHHPIWTALVSAVLVALGVLLVAFAPGATAVGLLLYGLGNGLRAIVRGMLPLVLMPASQYVALMGKMSRPSLIGQALTPLVGGYLMQHFGAMGVLVVLCSLALINVVLVGLVFRSLQGSPAPRAAVEESHDDR
ncbi:MFS transporter [Pseudomonas syringae]|nr:MFS transporter [Pseudomonas syringae]